jgi:DNA invertase Pin-like site-specific DNA recombinase
MTMNSARLSAVPDRLRLIAYLRVSDEHGRGVDLLSPDIQLRACREFAARTGGEIVDVITDIDRTGRKWTRRQIEAQVRRVEAGEADGIVVWKWSRLARNRKDWALAIARVEGGGGQLLSATEPFDDTAAGELGRDMLIAISVFDSNSIGEGWTATHRARFESGLPAHGSVPWCMTSARRTVEIDPRRADIVRELYRRYIDGEGSVRLAEWMREIGEIGGNGAPWHPNSIIRMLDNPIHAGIVTYRGETRKAAFDVVIDADTFADYQAQRRDRRRKDSRATSVYLLAGIAVCGECGHPLVGQPGRPGHSPRLRCQYGQIMKLHPSVNASAADIDAQVLAWLTAQALDADIAAAPAPAPPPAFALTVQDIEERIAKLDKEMTTLTRRLNAEIVSERDYANTRDAVNADRAQLVAELQVAMDRVQLAPTVPIGTLARVLVRDWSTLPVVERRAALRQMLECVTVARVDGQLTVTPVPLTQRSG